MSSVGPFHVDHLSIYIRTITLVGGVLLTHVLWDQVDDGRAAEAHACLLAVIAA